MRIPQHPRTRAARLAVIAVATLTAPACALLRITTPATPEYVDCTRFADPRTSNYILPFQTGASFKISKTFGHYSVELNGGVGLYAVDMLMPIGTPIVAIRAGVVVAVEERFSDTDRADYHENWVMVRHADSTVARYIHLTTNGVLVNVGDVVQQGQEIARSGNSGPSGEPHLHLDVQTCGPNLPPAYNRRPCGMTVPLSFRNTTVESCGLRAGSRYTAQPLARAGHAE